MLKKASALLLVLALFGGTVGYFALPAQARAATTSTLSSEAEATIAVLRQLIALLQSQILALGGTDEEGRNDDKPKSAPRKSSSGDPSLTISSGDDNPGSSVFSVEKSELSEEYILLEFDLYAEGADLEVNNFPFTFEVISGDDDVRYIDVAERFILTIDDQEFRGAYTGGDISQPDTQIAFQLDYKGVIVPEGETVHGSVAVQFKEQRRNYDDDTEVRVRLTAGDTDAIVVVPEGKPTDKLQSNDLHGKAEGEIHELSVD